MHSLSSFIVKYAVEFLSSYFPLFGSVCFSTFHGGCSLAICNNTHTYTHIWDAAHKYTSLHCWYLYDTNMTYSFFVRSPSLCLKILARLSLRSRFVVAFTIPFRIVLGIFGAWSKKHTHAHNTTLNSKNEENLTTFIRCFIKPERNIYNNGT